MNQTLVSIALAIVIFTAGVFVGNLTAGDRSPMEAISDTVGAVSADKDSQSATTADNTDDGAGDEVIFTIDMSSLGATEKAFLASAGITGDSINVTASMYSCAEAKLGTQRITEIKNGATPSAAEGVKLVGCY